MIDTYLMIEGKTALSNNIKLKKGCDNWILLKLFSGGAAVNLTQRTNVEIRLSDDTNLYSISEANSPLNFYVTGVDGELMVRAAKTAAPIGLYNFSLWYYDLSYNAGVMFGVNQNIIIEIA